MAEKKVQKPAGKKEKWQVEDEWYKPYEDADKGKYTAYDITLQMQAGFNEYSQYPGAEKTKHAGIGYLHPFGKCDYWAGFGFPEQKKHPRPDYFNKTWESQFKTKYFCVYSLTDGDIYAYDGIVANYEPYKGDSKEKRDHLINVIVGGSGAYKGCNGMMLGMAPGRGDARELEFDVKLPQSILKLMSGYINVPVKNKKK
ncbi:MAG: hypothetical protein A2Z02_06895 [Chloroflexi bacterium RBG_16_48_7]|nr:MAG: hypothetical protein A2Z02_06895 [Chloroflexi bacterium RBG_16_48_7]